MTSNSVYGLLPFSSRIFKCERVPESTIDYLLSTISDRCRLPACTGRGAVKLRPDVIVPAIVIPSCLCLATLHPVITAVCFLFMPFFIITFHALWRRSEKHRRTLFFYSWGLTSVISSYLVFQVSEERKWGLVAVVVPKVRTTDFDFINWKVPEFLFVQCQNTASGLRNTVYKLALSTWWLRDHWPVGIWLGEGEMGSPRINPALRSQLAQQAGAEGLYHS